MMKDLKIGMCITVRLLKIYLNKAIQYLFQVMHQYASFYLSFVLSHMQQLFLQPILKTIG